MNSSNFLDNLTFNNRDYSQQLLLLAQLTSSPVTSFPANSVNNHINSSRLAVQANNTTLTPSLPIQSFDLSMYNHQIQNNQIALIQQQLLNNFVKLSNKQSVNNNNIIQKQNQQQKLASYIFNNYSNILNNCTNNNIGNSNQNLVQLFNVGSPPSNCNQKQNLLIMNQMNNNNNNNNNKLGGLISQELNNSNLKASKNKGKVLKQIYFKLI